MVLIGTERGNMSTVYECLVTAPACPRNLVIEVMEIDLNGGWG